MANKRVLVVGGDGYCGWATALHLSKLGYDVAIRRQPDPPALGRHAPHRYAHADRADRTAHRGLAAPDRQHDRPVHRRRRRLRRSSRAAIEALRARCDRAFRRTALGAVLDDRSRARRDDANRQRDRHAEHPLRDARLRAERAPREARHDGRVRHAEYRHRRRLHRDPAQRPARRAAVSETAGFVLSSEQGPRFRQHLVRLPHLGLARDRPQSRRRLRQRRSKPAAIRSW